MASTPSSGPFFKGMEENQQNPKMQQHFPNSSSQMAAPPPTLDPQKRKRNQCRTPNADAEIIALSPRTLTTANRFICEVCNKGFQREQNLQLHRRGHNLPWKLKQNNDKEVRKKVYICPEPTCVHHDPSRALGDLTGIKKHYFRKHGEKKYKCEKCSKKYAVQSDWKAHSKICGSREYICDCGTLFSRRDSFMTHRAFCNALAQERERPPNLNTLGAHNLYGNIQVGNLGQSHVGSQISPIQDQNPPSRAHTLRLGNHGVGNPTLPNMAPSSYLLGDTNQEPFPNKPLHGLMQLPDLQGDNAASHSSSAVNLINLGFFGAQDNSITTNTIEGNNNMVTSGFLNLHDHLFDNSEDGTGQQGITLFSNNIGDEVGSAEGISSLLGTSIQRNISPHMSATALLQKVAHMGSTTSNTNNSTLVRNLGSSSSSDGKSKNQMLSTNFGTNVGSHETQFQMMNNALGHPGISFGGFNTGGFSLDHHNGSPNFGYIDGSKLYQGLGGDENKLTVDFLGVGDMVRNFGGGFPPVD